MTLNLANFRLEVMGYSHLPPEKKKKTVTWVEFVWEITSGNPTKSQPRLTAICASGRTMMPAGKAVLLRESFWWKKSVFVEHVGHLFGNPSCLGWLPSFWSNLGHTGLFLRYSTILVTCRAGTPRIVVKNDSELKVPKVYSNRVYLETS